MSENATTDLAEWLLVQIAEDEAAARDASPGPWHVDTESATVLAVDDIEVCDGFALSGPQLRATTRHIARWDPGRVLAECEAKRRIVWAHQWVPAAPVGPNARISVCLEDGAQMPCPTLIFLALPYVDRPGYDPAWGVA